MTNLVLDSQYDFDFHIPEHIEPCTQEEMDTLYINQWRVRVRMNAFDKLLNCRWKCYFKDKIKGRNVVVPLKISKNPESCICPDGAEDKCINILCPRK